MNNKGKARTYLLVIMGALILLKSIGLPKNHLVLQIKVRSLMLRPCWIKQ